MTYAIELYEWLRTLDTPFLFLLAIPFAVAGAALLHDWLEKREARARTAGRPLPRV